MFTEPVVHRLGQPRAAGGMTTFPRASGCLLAVLAMSVPAPAQEAPLRTAIAIQDAQFQPAQGLGDPARPLPNEIAAMPDIQEEMEVIQRRSQLVVTRGAVVRTAIADPSVIDLVQFSPTEFSIIGLQLGSTTMTLWFENSREPLIYLVKTIPDPSLEERRRVDYGKLERKLHALFPNSKVYLIPLSTKIIVKGQARDAEEAARILQIVRGEVINQEGGLLGPGTLGANAAYGGTGIGFAGGPGVRQDGGNGFGDLYSSFIVNMLEVPGEYQVMLRVRIAELKRSQLQRFGIDFNYLLNNGRHAIGYTMGAVPSTVTGILENGEIDVLVNWLAANGTVKILSEPTLTVLSGHSASFLSGGEFAVPTIVGIDGVGAQQTTFRGYGTSIIVTPLVIDRDLIRLRIIPEYSEINAQTAVGGIPGLNSRRVQTTVELREGQTIVLGGLFASRSDTEVTRIPLLGDIPWVGPKLFSAKRATMDESELLVLVSPELVRPMDADEVPPMPGWYVTHPDSCQLYYHALTEGSPDQQVYQLAPYGRGNGQGLPVGYHNFEPAPSQPNYNPGPGNGGSPTPAPAYGMPGGQRAPMMGPPGAMPPAMGPGGIPNQMPAAPPPAARRPVPNAGPSAQYSPSGIPMGNGSYTQQAGGPVLSGPVVPSGYEQQIPSGDPTGGAPKKPSRFGRRQ